MSTKAFELNFNRAGAYIVNQGNVGSDAVPFGRIRAGIKASDEDVTYDAGMIMGKITATGEWTPVKMDANDGSEVAKGILFAPVEMVAGEANTAPIDTGVMTVHSAYLSLIEPVSTDELNAIKLALEEAGFSFRNWDENEFTTIVGGLG